MSNAIYTMLSRQAGLVNELQTVSNNIANASTTGYKSDRAIFAEYVIATGPQTPSLSVGGLAGHSFELSQGGLATTGGPFDLAIQGDGFFLVQTAQGVRLTRAGHFQLSADGTLINGQGNGVLNAGGGAITFPPEAERIGIGADGTISVNGEAFDRVGVVTPNGELSREMGTLFIAADGFVPSQTGVVVQGALEQSNVVPVLEVARMIEVQRAYDAGQSLLEAEDQRVSQIISALRDR